MAGRIEINIEELVLNGFASGDRDRIGESFRVELARLMTRQSIPRSLLKDQTIDQLDADEFNYRMISKPESTGNQIAETVYRRLKQ